MKRKHWFVMLIALVFNWGAYAEITEEDIANMTSEELERWISEGEIIRVWEELLDPNNPYDRYVARKSFEERFPERRSFRREDLTFDTLHKAAEIYSFGEYEVKKSPTYKLSDSDMANDILFKQDQMISYFENALTNFGDTLSKPSRKSATPDFGKALGSYFGKKIVGFFGEGVPGIGVPLPGFFRPLEVLGAVREEYDRATKAKEGAAGRDFIIEHRDHASDFRKALALKSDAFRAVIGNVNTAGPFAEAMKIDGTKLLNGLKVEVAATSTEKIFYDLTNMWINQSTYGDNPEPAYIHVWLNIDGSTKGVQMFAPSGSALGEKLNDYYPNGTDIFRMKDVRIKVSQEIDHIAWKGVQVIVENGVVMADPFYPKGLTDKLAKHLYDDFMKKKHLFKDRF